MALCGCGAERAGFEGHLAAVRGIHVKGDEVLSWSDDGTLRVWGRDGSQHHVVNYPLFDVSKDFIRNARLRGDEVLALVGSRLLLRARDGREISPINTNGARIANTYFYGEEMLSWTRDGKLLIHFRDGRLIQAVALALPYEGFAVAGLLNETTFIVATATGPVLFDLKHHASSTQHSCIWHLRPPLLISRQGTIGSSNGRHPGGRGNYLHRNIR
jgi:hypothetical protein